MDNVLRIHIEKLPSPITCPRDQSNILDSRRSCSKRVISTCFASMGRAAMAVSDQRPLERTQRGPHRRDARRDEEAFRRMLIHIPTVFADTEMISAPSYSTAAKDSPSWNGSIRKVSRQA